MSEIDLIPNLYREQVWRLGYFKRCALVLLILVGVLLLASGGLFYLTGKIESEVQRLQQEKAVTTRQRDQLQQLTNHKEELQRQLGLLSELRGGTTAESIIVALDKTLRQDEVWFLQWEFNRAGEVVNTKEAETKAGYFMVMPADGKKKEAETWPNRPLCRPPPALLYTQAVLR